MCHMSHVTFHMSHVAFFFFGQSGEAYRWRVCYQRGLPRLVSVEVSISYEYTEETRNLKFEFLNKLIKPSIKYFLHK